MRSELGCRVSGESDRMLTVAVAYPDVAGVDEGQVVLRDRGLSQQPRSQIIRAERIETMEDENEGKCPDQEPALLVHVVPLSVRLRRAAAAREDPMGQPCPPRDISKRGRSPPQDFGSVRR